MLNTKVLDDVSERLNISLRFFRKLSTKIFGFEII